MVVGRRGSVRTSRVQPGGGAPLDGERAASADAAHAAALRLLTTRARSRAELRQRLEDRGFEAAAVAETLDRLERVGLVKKSGAWFTYDGDQLGQGRENARNFLRDNPELAREIEEKIKAQLGVGLPPVPTPDPDADKAKDQDKL